MKILLALIACCLLAACQSTPSTSASSKPPIIQDEPTVASTAPSKDLVIMGRLAGIQKTPDCGVFHLSAVAEYTDLRVITGTYPYDVVYVRQGCPELKRSEYAQGGGDLEAFNMGDYHELPLTKENVYHTAEHSNDPHPSNQLYFCREVNLYRREPAVTPKLEHPGGEALEGVYLVSWGSLDRTYDIGTLKLKDGLYSFTPLIPAEQIPQAATDRLFFVRNPQGQYSLKYQDPINENTLLEELNDFTFLVLIQFSIPASALGEMQHSNGMFFIASDQESKSLLFHSFYSELQQWGVGKAWD